MKTEVETMITTHSNTLLAKSNFIKIIFAASFFILIINWNVTANENCSVLAGNFQIANQNFTSQSNNNEGNGIISEWNVTERSGVVTCSWATAFEKEVDYFLLERSRDGIHFSIVDRIDASGNSTGTLDYNFTDQKPFAGMNYYRLVRVNYDGETEYFETRTIHVEKNLELFLYPNPTDGRLINLVIQSDTEASVEVFLLDSMGREVWCTAQDISSGRDQVTYLSNDPLPKDIYTLQLILGGQAYSKSVVIK